MKTALYREKHNEKHDKTATGTPVAVFAFETLLRCGFFAVCEQLRPYSVPEQFRFATALEQFHFEIALAAARADARREGVSAIYLRG